MKWLVPDRNFSHGCYFRDIGPKKWYALEIVDYAIQGPLLTLALACGVSGGLLCITTFAKCLPKLQIYRHLLILAIWDLAYSLIALLLYNLPVLIHQDMVHWGFRVVFNPYLYYLASVARVGSIWTMILLAFHKYLALCYPFRFHNFDSKRTCCFVTLGVAVAAFLFGLPRFFENTADQCREVMTGEWIWYMTDWKTIRSNKYYWLIYRVIGGGLFYSFVPFVLLLFLTCRLWFEIRRMNRNQPPAVSDDHRPSITLTVISTDPSMEYSESDHMLHHGDHLTVTSDRRMSDKGRTANTSAQRFNSANKGGAVSVDRMNNSMHITLITKFVICHLFPTILDIVESVERSNLLNNPIWTLLSSVDVFLTVVNSSCNFFIYYGTSVTFRHDCKRTMIDRIRCCRKQKTMRDRTF